MSEVFTYIIAMSLVVSLCSFIAHPRADGKSTKWALGIILIASVITPVGSFISEVKNFELTAPDTEDISEDYDKYIEEAYRESLTVGVAAEFSIDKSNIDIEITDFDRKELSCGECVVTLYGTAALADYKAIQGYILSAGAEKCEVKIFK